MRVLITGGAGFIGRWTVKKFLDEGHAVIAYDNLYNSSKENIQEFFDNKDFEFIQASVLDKSALSNVFKSGIDLCLHMAAQINVQDSLDNPKKNFEDNVIGTQNVLEECHAANVKIVLMGTCMVYDVAGAKKAIDETHPEVPRSPYAGSKLAAEYMALSYFYGYGLPVVIVRPFNTYGPFQKSNMEGGVVSIFVGRKIKGEDLKIFGDGTQTRDLLYVEDCAEFLYLAATNYKAVGQVFNAGTGVDITVNELAKVIAKKKSKIKHVAHHHPQAEIQKLQCDATKAKNVLGWVPKTSLEQGIKRVEQWLSAK